LKPLLIPRIPAISRPAGIFLPHEERTSISSAGKKSYLICWIYKTEGLFQGIAQSRFPGGALKTILYE